MRRNKKSRILAVLLAVSLSGSSAVYAQAEEVNNPDTDIEICGEEHEMKEVQVVEPTCTEAGYVQILLERYASSEISGTFILI